MSIIQKHKLSLLDGAYGLIKKIHGHFYYLESFSQIEIGDKKHKNYLPLTLPSRLKKEGVDVFVGDIVEYDIQDKCIKQVLTRESLLTRPKVANIDQTIVVVAVASPAPELEYIDRVLCHASLSTPEKPILCLTKTDLPHDDEFANLYKGLGYKVIKVSNYPQQNIKELQESLIGKTSVLAGQSGVGKSSLINSILPELNIKEGDVSNKTKKGTHTTRHTELFDGYFQNEHYRLLDTPGFSRLDAHFTVSEIASSKAFPEINLKQKDCAFADCTHRDEEGCQVLFSNSRKKSYSKLINEAENYEEDNKLADKDKLVKTDSETNIPRLTGKQRSQSRKAIKQNKNYED